MTLNRSTEQEKQLDNNRKGHSKAIHFLECGLVEIDHCFVDLLNFDEASCPVTLDLLS